MMNRDYTKEVGVDSGAKTIPWPVASLALALVGVGVWYMVSEARAAAHKEELQKAQSAAVAKAEKK
jgi:hypothetical protein